MRAQPLSKHPVHSAAIHRRIEETVTAVEIDGAPLPPSHPPRRTRPTVVHQVDQRGCDRNAHTAGEGGGAGLFDRETGGLVSLCLSLSLEQREVNVLRPLRGRTLFNNALLRTLTRYNGDRGEGGGV